MLTYGDAPTMRYLTYMRLLPLHIPRTPYASTGLRIKIHHHHRPRPRNCPTRKKIPALPPWIKRNAQNTSDVTMGSYDGAETCELIGLYMLSLIAPNFKDQLGLYHDDGIAVCKATPKRSAKQEVCNVFKSNGLKITIEANKNFVNFLDVTLDFTSGNYKLIYI